jgi:hypothetical protein
MLTFTVGQFIDEDECINERTEPYCIYVVHDGANALYVGKSKNVIMRLWSHLGTEIHGGWPGFGNRASDLGRMIEANLPESRAWTIDLLTLEDCRLYSVFPIDARDVDEAEAGLVKLLKPCLNKQLNVNLRDDRLTCYRSPWEKIPAELWPFQ